MTAKKDATPLGVFRHYMYTQKDGPLGLRTFGLGTNAREATQRFDSTVERLASIRGNRSNAHVSVNVNRVDVSKRDPTSVRTLLGWRPPPPDDPTRFPCMVCAAVVCVSMYVLKFCNTC